ncbi:MAG: MFS transporter [Myxococcota bacterium]
MSPDAPRGRGLLGAFGVYRDARLLAIFGMGIASGLPLLLTTSTLAYWLAREGLDTTSIGLFAAVGLPYALKFLWAPVLDRVAWPGIGRLGRRRSWILATQAGLVAAILALGGAEPAARPLATGLLALAIAFLSATQDVAVDAYRIEILGTHEQGPGAAATQAGYRVGLVLAGAGAIALSDFVAWNLVFASLAGVQALAMLFVVAAPEPAPTAGASIADAPIARAWVEPLADVLRWPRVGAILAFALLYKLGDAVAGAMASPFYVDLGFSGVEIASVTKVAGVAAQVVGIAAGGVLVARARLGPALLVGGVLQAATNLLFSWLAGEGHDVAALAVAVVADSFTGGVAATAFVAYFSGWSRGPYSASQYALLTSLMALGRALFGAASGWLAAELGWGAFFALTAALALPGLALIAVVPQPGERGERS